MGRLLYTDELCEYVNARTHLQFDGSPSLFLVKLLLCLSLSALAFVSLRIGLVRVCVCECYVNSLHTL